MEGKGPKPTTMSASNFSLSAREYGRLVSAAIKQFRYEGGSEMDAREFVHQALKELLETGKADGKEFVELKSMVLNRARWRWKDEIRREGREFVPDVEKEVDEEAIMDLLAWRGPDRERQLEDEPEFLNEYEETLKEKLKLLNDKECWVFMRIFNEGATREEVAQELGVKRNSVDKIVSRSVKKMADDQDSNLFRRFYY